SNTPTKSAPTVSRTMPEPPWLWRENCRRINRMSVSVSPASAGFRDLLHSGRFLYGIEVVTTRGPLTDDRPQDVVSFAHGLLYNPRIGWISITDNPGGGPMLPPDWL